MNPSLLSIDVQAYLKENEKTSPSAIALKKSPFPDTSSAELAEQVDSYQRLKTKLPTWCSTENIYYPPRQNAEQCSSEETAHYKASLATGQRAIDLTGGFGVDTWAFAKWFDQVDYCEMNTALFPIVSHNFSALACANVKCHLGDGLAYLKKKYDLIYLDPARRDEHNRKMVSFSDCLPDIIDQQDFLFRHSDKIMLKASPMMDISLALEELKNVKEIHVVALKNECKELLFILDKKYKGEAEINCVNLPQQQVFKFKRNDEHIAKAALSAPQKYLYEPNSAILKAGAFNTVSQQLHLRKLHPSTHLYTSDKHHPDFPGKVYEVAQVLDYNKKKIKPYIPQGKANIKTYNFPNTPQQVQKKLGLKDGGELFLFGAKTWDDKYRMLLTTLL